MGTCLSSEFKPEASLLHGVSPTCVDNKRGNNISRPSSKVISRILPKFKGTKEWVSPTCVDNKRGKNISRPSSKVISMATPSNSQEAKGEILQSPNLMTFCFNELQKATENFSQDCLLGEGNFGYVFKGWINEHSLKAVKPETGMAIAVKRFNQKGCQGQQEWLVEIKYLGQLCHPNLVKLIGYCIEDDQRLLVYEFMPRGSLENHLFRRCPSFPPLTWNVRLKVALGVAKGLAFLHDVANVIYRDFKTSDVLLDLNYNAKLTDFGLATDGPIDGKTHVSTRVMGAEGYAAPEYMSTGHLTTKSDVYSFGVMFLEMLCGMRVMDRSRPCGEQNLIEWARPCLSSKRNSFQLLDTCIDGQYTFSAIRQACILAVRCLSADPKFRPNMQEVVRVLEQLYNSKISFSFSHGRGIRT